MKIATSGKTPSLKIKASIKTTKADISDLNRDITKIAKELNPIKLKITFDDKASGNAVNSLTDKMKTLQTTMNKFNKNFESFGSAISQGAKKAAKDTKAAKEAVDELAGAAAKVGNTKGSQKVTANTSAFSKSVDNAKGKLATLQRQMMDFEKKNPRFAERYSDDVTELKNSINDLYFKYKDVSSSDFNQENLDEINQSYANHAARLKSLRVEMDQAGLAGTTLGDRLKAAIEKFGGWAIVTKAMSATWRQFRQMYENVKNLDAAMTELKKVTEETDSEYDKFLTRATKRAKELGATLTDTVTATAD